MIRDKDKVLLKRYRHIIAALIADDDFIAINRNILKASIKYRHCLDFKLALTVVDQNILGHESLGASWF